MNFGRLGRSFGKLGSSVKAGTGGGGGGAAPSLDFSQASNSQYLPLVMSVDEDPFQSVDRELLGINWKRKGKLP